MRYLYNAARIQPQLFNGNGKRLSGGFAPPTLHSIDAIRGVAACAVIARHLFSQDPAQKMFARIFPLPLELLSIWDAAGVHAFFVLSGFVIAHSLRRNSLDAADIGNFALRRQMRLDPP